MLKINILKKSGRIRRLKPVYRHPLPSEGAMGEGYGNWYGFSHVLHHFGLFFPESKDESA